MLTRGKKMTTLKIRIKIFLSTNEFHLEESSSQRNCRSGSARNCSLEERVFGLVNAEHGEVAPKKSHNVERHRDKHRDVEGMTLIEQESVVSLHEGREGNEHEGDLEQGEHYPPERCLFPAAYLGLNNTLVGGCHFSH